MVSSFLSYRIQNLPKSNAVVAIAVGPVNDAPFIQDDVEKEIVLHRPHSDIPITVVDYDVEDTVTVQIRFLPDISDTSLGFRWSCYALMSGDGGITESHRLYGGKRI